jgi:multidrug efflux system membrane fusion protein
MANDELSQKGAGPVPTAPKAEQPRKSGGGMPWKSLVAGAVLIVIAFVVWQRESHHASPQTKSKGGGRGGGPSGPVSVMVGTAVKKDVPIYLDGLGTVQAFNMVTVRSRVDGQLLKLGFREGQDVKEGDLLAQIDPAAFQAQLEQAVAKKAQDDAQLTFAELELKRDADLLTSKIVSQEVYDTQKATVNQLAATVKADQAAIDNARVQLDYCTIKSPMDGRTGIRLVDQGNIIHSSESNGIVVLTQLRPISVIFTLPEQTLGEIRAETSDDAMTVLAVDRDNHTVLDEGNLAVIDNQIDVTTGTIRLKSTFPNPKLKLWPGQFVNARLLLKVRTGGIVVPASVVQRGPEGAYVFAVQDDMSVKMVPVKVGQIDQNEALIDSGLNEGERVVVDGQYKLQPGSKIKPAEAARPAGAGSATNRPPTNEGKKGHSGKSPKPGGTNESAG